MTFFPLSRTFCGFVAFSVAILTAPCARAVTLDGKVIADVAVACVDSLARAGGLESIQVSATSTPSPREVSGAGTTLVAAPTSSVATAGVHMVPVQAVDSDGNRRTLATIGVQVTRFGLVPKARRPLRRGDVVQEDDVDWCRSAVPNTLELPVPSPTGSRLRRGTRTGDILTANLLDALPVISRGDRVEITAERGAVRVTFTGHAVDDGGLGDRFRVTDPHNHQTIRARVTGPGRAILEP